MKPIVVIAAGLIVGVGGGTAVSALKVKGQVEAEMAARADSLALLETELAQAENGSESEALAGDTPAEGGEILPDSGAVADSVPADAVPTEDESPEGDAEPEETEAAPGAETGAELPADSAVADSTATPNPGTATPPTATDAAPESANAPTVTAEGARRMAKIFGAMRAEDAAGVMAELGDREIAAILGELNDRTASSILGAFDPERAARLSRLLLGGGVS